MKEPIFRFKGYTDAWEQRKLGDIANKVTTKNVGTQYVETLTNSAEQGIISQRDYFDHDVSNMENIDGYYIVEDNDFVYNPRISTSAPVGPVNRNKLGRTGVMSPLYTVFRTHDIDEEYLEWYFKSSCWHKFMFFNGDTGARADRFAIKDSVFFEMPIPTPHIDEQCKIGRYMIGLDNLIALNQRKCDALKELKKGMLQKMFPKDGEKVPEFRFKGFTGDWEQRKFKDVSKKLCVGFVGTCEKYYTDKVNGVPMYRTGNIKDGFLVEDDMKYVSKEFHEKNKKSQLKKNDILIARFGENGLGALYLRNEEANCLNCIILRPNDQVNAEYVKQYLSSDSFRRKTFANTVGSTFSILNTTMLGKMDIPFTSLHEQNAIANYLSNFDNLIILYQRKCDALKGLKKGFLQKMFI